MLRRTVLHLFRSSHFQTLQCLWLAVSSTVHSLFRRLFVYLSQKFNNFFIFPAFIIFNWMCGVKLKDRLTSKELRERLGVDDIASVLQQNRLRWYGHVLRKDDEDWVKKCMEHEVEGSRPRGRPKKTWKEVVREDCQARKLNKEDAMDRCKQRKVIKEARWSGWVWVGECFFWYRPTWVVPDQRPLNGRCIIIWHRIQMIG